MKAAIYSPYLDTLGGGELYVISFALVLNDAGYDVDIEWRDKKILNAVSSRFGIKIGSNIRVVDTIKKGIDYDLCFWVSDGSVPTLGARANYLHFQVPFHDVNGRSLLNKMKFFRITKTIVNSEFTKKVIDNEYGLDATVIYPPVNIGHFNPKHKEDVILYVGRFSNLVQNKRQDILLEAFKVMTSDKKYKDWKLVLAGGAEVGSSDFLDKLKNDSMGLPVEILEGPDFNTLKRLYGTAKIFWSAAGFGADTVKNPERFEHFGITLVEAMAAKCVPLVFDGGGFTEIIDSGKNGYLWKNVEELVELTKELATNTRLLSQMSKLAQSASKQYDYPIFKDKVLQTIK